MEDGERTHDVVVHHHHHGGLTLGLPAPNLPAAVAGTGGGGSSREDCWSEGATNTLIDSWGERYLNLNRGNLKQKHWREVSDSVNARAGGHKLRKTDVQCKNRLDTLKKKYKLEKAKFCSGAMLGAPKWSFYAKLDNLIGPSRSKHQVLKHLHPHPHPHPQPQPLPPPLPPPLPSKRPDGGFNSVSSGSLDATESLPSDGAEEKGKRGRRSSSSSENPVRELAQAIMKFGEVYERIEKAKQQQMMELEKQRMEFTRDLEVQRMQLFMQTQIEVAKMEHAKHGGTEHYL